MTLYDYNVDGPNGRQYFKDIKRLQQFHKSDVDDRVRKPEACVRYTKDQASDLKNLHQAVIRSLDQLTHATVQFAAAQRERDAATQKFNQFLWDLESMRER